MSSCRETRRRSGGSSPARVASTRRGACSCRAALRAITTAAARSLIVTRTLEIPAPRPPHLSTAPGAGAAAVGVMRRPIQVFDFTSIQINFGDFSPPRKGGFLRASAGGCPLTRRVFAPPLGRPL